MQSASPRYKRVWGVARAASLPMEHATNSLRSCCGRWVITWNVTGETKAWDHGHSCRMLGRRSPIGHREYTPHGMSVRVRVLVCFHTGLDRLAVSLQG